MNWSHCSHSWRFGSRYDDQNDVGVQINGQGSALSGPSVSPETEVAFDFRSPLEKMGLQIPRFVKDSPVRSDH